MLAFLGLSDCVILLYVTRYEKINHSQANMILQYEVQCLHNIIFSIVFSLQITKVWSLLVLINKISCQSIAV